MGRLFKLRHQRIGIANHYKVDLFIGMTLCQFSDAFNDRRNVIFLCPPDVANMATFEEAAINDDYLEEIRSEKKYQR